MSNPYRHPISTPVPELQGKVSIASKSTTPPASGVTVPEGEVAEVRDVLMTDRFGCKPAALSTPSATPGEEA